jgi:propionyl-CoA carboxylase alpha chain
MTATPIRRLLVANRGEIARRIFRTAHALGISTVAVYSDADADAPYVREADRSVRLPGVSSTETYLDAGLILAAAISSALTRSTPATASCRRTPTSRAPSWQPGLVWIGPTPESIEAMGLKLEAKRIARAGRAPRRGC